VASMEGRTPREGPWFHGPCFGSGSGCRFREQKGSQKNVHRLSVDIFLAPFLVVFVVSILGSASGSKCGPMTRTRSSVACVLVSGRAEHEEGNNEVAPLQKEIQQSKVFLGRDGPQTEMVLRQ
jgi:hypothetical protein